MDLEMRWGRGNLRSFSRSCLMYGRLTSSVFSISTTLRIYLENQQIEFPDLEINWTYVDRPETGTMSGSHILVQSLNSIGSWHLTVLLVHVVSSGAGIISDPDTEVLNLHWALLRDLQKWKIRILKHSNTALCNRIPRSSWRFLHLPSWPFSTSSRSTRNETLQQRCLVQKFSCGTTLGLGWPRKASDGQWPGIL